MNDVKKYLNEIVSANISNLLTEIEESEYDYMAKYYTLHREVKKLLEALPIPVREWTVYKEVSQIIEG